MKTLLYPEWDRVRLADAPRPSPAADEVLLRVAACGLCGSELEAFKSHSPRRTPPNLPSLRPLRIKPPKKTP